MERRGFVGLVASILPASMVKADTKQVTFRANMATGFIEKPAEMKREPNAITWSASFVPYADIYHIEMRYKGRYIRTITEKLYTANLDDTIIPSYLLTSTPEALDVMSLDQMMEIARRIGLRP